MPSKTPAADAPPRPRKKSAAKKKSRAKSRAVGGVPATIERPEAGVPRGAPIPGRNGGTLIPGAGRGPEPGKGGRPTSLLRSNLTAVLEAGVPHIAAIASGQLVEKTRARIRDLAPYLKCANCGEGGSGSPGLGMVIADAENHMYVTIEVEQSATAADRIRALDLAGKYGPGAVKQIGVEVVRDKVVETLDLLRERLDPKIFDELRPLLRDIWVVKAA